MVSKYEIEENKGTGGYCAVLEKDGQHYFADLSLLPVVGPEFMVFHSDENGNVEDWGEIMVRRPFAVTRDIFIECANEFLSSDIC